MIPSRAIIRTATGILVIMGLIRINGAIINTFVGILIALLAR